MIKMLSTTRCIMVYTCVLLVGGQVGLSVQATTAPTAAPTTTTTIGVAAEDSTSSASTTTTSDVTSDQSSTETSSTAITTPTPEISCYNGSCHGNVSDTDDVSCIKTTDQCVLKDGEKCFQTVFKNNSVIVFELGCKANCEYLVEEGAGTDTMATTRCCDTDLCNKELLSDPDLGNAAVSVTSSLFISACLVILFKII